MATRRKYAAEFKREAVELVRCSTQSRACGTTPPQAGPLRFLQKTNDLFFTESLRHGPLLF
jgi:hypothetical protein